MRDMRKVVWYLLGTLIVFTLSVTGCGDDNDGGAITFIPVEWGVDADDHDGGIHFVSMVADVSPLTVDDLQDLGGKLVWEETQVILCTCPGTFSHICIRDVGDGYLRIGDLFSSNEENFETASRGCSINMQNAFDDFGHPETACLSVRSGDVDYEYCAPLNVLVPDSDFLTR